MNTLVQRARPLLGTLVSVQLRVPAASAAVLEAMDAAFEEIEAVHRLMSAHAPDSDLGHLADAHAGERVALHPHTEAVLRLAQHWQRESRGAFDAQAAGERLAALGRRPGLRGAQAAPARFARLVPAAQVTLDGPLRLDLGGLAKGYAVDQAVRVLRGRGIGSGLVNAGGDLRAFGPLGWRVELQHPKARSRAQRMLRLRDAALATSVRSEDFVATARGRGSWQRCTVLARDCASADAFTKWGLQAREPSLALRIALTRQGARLWRD